MAMPGGATEHIVLEPADILDSVYQNGHATASEDKTLSDSHDRKHSRDETVGVPGKTLESDSQIVPATTEISANVGMSAGKDTMVPAVIEPGFPTEDAPVISSSTNKRMSVDVGDDTTPAATTVSEDTQNSKSAVTTEDTKAAEVRPPSTKSAQTPKNLFDHIGAFAEVCVKDMHS